MAPGRRRRSRTPLTPRARGLDDGRMGGHARLVQVGLGVLVCTLLAAVSGCTAGMRPPEDPLEGFEGPIRSRDVGEGGRIFIQLCSACHRGRVNPRGYDWTPAQMRHQIRRGNMVMPPLPEEVISDAQVEAVLAYLAVTGALNGELPPEQPREIDDGEVFDDRTELAHADRPETGEDEADGDSQDGDSESGAALDDPL